MVERIELNVARASAANRYKVPGKQWRKWGDSQRKRFNEVYSAMVSNQEMFLHPKAAPTKSQFWRTTAWNAAWTAADV